jgi:hypothetical protein
VAEIKTESVCDLLIRIGKDAQILSREDKTGWRIRKILLSFQKVFGNWEKLSSVPMF